MNSFGPLGGAPLAGTPAVNVFDVTERVAVAATAPLVLQAAHLLESCAPAALASSVANFVLDLAEATALEAIAAVVYTLVALETVVPTDVATISRRQLEVALEALEAVGLAESRLDAVEAVIEALAIHDLAIRGWREEHVESVAMLDALTHTSAALHDMVAAAAAADVAEPGLRLTVTLAEGVVPADVGTSTARFLQDTAEGLFASAVLTLHGEQYVAWVLNAESEAASYYDIGFTSAAEFDGRTFVTTDTGFYELGGADDDGAAISAEVRGGLLDFGSSLVKGMSMSYLMLTADGELVLKLHVTDPDTHRREVHWYQLEGRTGDMPHEDRVKPDGGLYSVRWGWSLVNRDGADFSIDSVSFVPMLTSRRV